MVMNQNDTESIVKEFLDLWQKQCAYMSRDVDSGSQALDAFLKMQETYANAINTGLGSKENAKSTATSDIFRNISNEFIKLAKSYAELEQRIVKLESCIAGGVAGSQKETTAKANARSRKRTTKTNN